MPSRDTIRRSRRVPWYEDTGEVAQLAQWMHETGRIVDPVDLLALVDAPWHYEAEREAMLAEFMAETSS